MGRGMRRTGTARDAAEVLGISLSTFHRSRATATLVVDHLSGTVRELSAPEQSDHPWQRRQHLVAPALFGQRLPGQSWMFDLRRLRRQLAEGPPGAEWGPGTLDDTQSH